MQNAFVTIQLFFFIAVVVAVVNFVCYLHAMSSGQYVSTLLSRHVKLFAECLHN